MLKIKIIHVKHEMCLFFLKGKMGMPGFPGINGIPVRILYFFFFRFLEKFHGNVQKP